MARITLSPPSKKPPAFKTRSRAKKAPAPASASKKASVPKKASQIKHTTPEPNIVEDDTSQLFQDVENDHENGDKNGETNLTTNTSPNSDQGTLEIERLNLNTPPSTNKAKKRKISTNISSNPANLTTLPSQTTDNDTNRKEPTSANDTISSSINTKKRKFESSSTPSIPLRKPASLAKKCPRCGGIHRSTCESNMERIDSINEQLGVIWTYTRAVGVLVAQITYSRSSPLSPSSPSSFNLSPSSLSDSFSFTTTTSAKFETQGGNRDRDVVKVEVEGKDKVKTATPPKRLYAEAMQWAEKSRRLLLEAAMREGDMEEGERLRGLIRRSKCSAVDGGGGGMVKGKEGC
ncbi:hypothetical protein BKA61DRAFT_566480 [Leptodontidium sp. MPI-SDFR-AT-0119]|nr:hypothetical protein BKA61DRAFT_566480 [Leptodontidium sp. MPI-SDFR-AT-0119]